MVKFKGLKIRKHTSDKNGSVFDLGLVYFAGVEFYLTFQIDVSCGQGDIRDFPGNYTQYRDWKDAKVHQEKEKEKEAAKAQEDKTAKVRLNEKRRMSFKEKREFEQLEQEIADLETEKNAIEEALCSGTLSVDELTEKSKRLPELSDLIDEKTLRWLELSEIESN